MATIRSNDGSLIEGDRPEDDDPITIDSMYGAISELKAVAGGLNDGHARWPVPNLGAIIAFLEKQDPQTKVTVTMSVVLSDRPDVAEELVMTALSFDDWTFGEPGSMLPFQLDKIESEPYDESKAGRP